MKRLFFAAMTGIMTLCLSGCGTAANEQPSEAVQTDLVIPVSEVTETARFYPITVDDTAMEVFAIKDSAGNIRTAFNTCQSCYTSGNGKYSVEGTDLVCQNCGFHFTADQVGANANGGCSPWRISADERTDNEETITISYEFLENSKNIFANWN